MNRTALSVIGLAVGAVLIIALFNIYRPAVSHLSHDVFGKVNTSLEHTAMKSNGRINYRLGQRVVSAQSADAGGTIDRSKLNVPKGFEIDGNIPDKIPVKDSTDIKIKPKANVDTEDYLEYRYNGKLVGKSPYYYGVDHVTSHDASDFTVNPHDAPGVPKGYHVTGGDGINGLTFWHMNGSHQVFVAPNQ